MSETIELKISAIREIFYALQNFDGQDKIVKNENGEKSVRIPYQLSGKIRWNIAKNINILRSLVEASDDAIKSIIREITEGKSSSISAKDNPREFELYNKKLNELLEEKSEINGLLKFKYNDFNLDEPISNPIPPTVLAILQPLIIDLENTEIK